MSVLTTSFRYIVSSSVAPTGTSFTWVQYVDSEISNPLHEPPIRQIAMPAATYHRTAFVGEVESVEN
jgi:hypothetical protein